MAFEPSGFSLFSTWASVFSTVFDVICSVSWFWTILEVSSLVEGLPLLDRVTAGWSFWSLVSSFLPVALLRKLDLLFRPLFYVVERSLCTSLRPYMLLSFMYFSSSFFDNFSIFKAILYNSLPRGLYNLQLSQISYKSFKNS